MAYNIIIAGGGFAGAHVAKILERELPKQSARVSLVNDVNFSLYTPLLPEAAAGTLEPRHVVTPLREILSRTHLRLGSIVDHRPGEVLYQSSRAEEWLQYDRLVVAIGSVARALPIKGLSEYATGFKNLSDAIWLRNNVIEKLEEANSEKDEKRAEELLTFVFVGGGYAGLEAIAELQDFAVNAIASYPLAKIRGMRWVLVDSAERVLKEIDSSLASYAASQLKARGIEIQTNTTLEKVEETSAHLSTGEIIPTRTVVWTAGVRPHPSLHNLGFPLDERERALVNKNLEIKENVWALGDCAAVPERGGGFAPPTAQHAIRQANVVAQNILASIDGGAKKEYTYRSQNAFVNLGRYKAVGKIGRFKFSGAPAWWMARTYHLMQMPGTIRKLRAILDWTVSLPFQRDLAELGTLGSPVPLEEYKKEGVDKAPQSTESDSKNI